MRHQRAADEDERRQPVEQAELADRVGDVDLGRRASGSPPARAPRRAQARPRRRRSAISAPRSGMARHDDGEEARKRAGEAPVRRRPTIASSPGWVLAATQTGRPRDAGRRAGRAARGIGRRRRRVELEVAGDRDPRRAEPRRAARRRPGSARGRGRSGRAAPRDVRQALPAPERALRHAPVDEDQRDAARVELEDGVRPDLGFGDEREVRLPVVEEAARSSAARRAARIGARRPAAGGGRASSAEVRVPEVTRT